MNEYRRSVVAELEELQRTLKQENMELAARKDAEVQQLLYQVNWIFL